MLLVHMQKYQYLEVVQLHLMETPWLDELHLHVKIFQSVDVYTFHLIDMSVSVDVLVVHTQI